jgi:MFS family permease
MSAVHKRSGVLTCCVIVIFSFLDRCSFIYPTYVFLFTANGVTPLEISLLLVLHNICKTMLDPHVGALADKYGIKRIIICGLWIKSLGILFWIANKSLVSFAIGFACIGIGRACITSKIDAYIYTSLASVNKKDMVRRVMIMRYMSCNVSAICCGLLYAYFCASGVFDKALYAGLFVTIALHIPFIFFFFSNKFTLPHSRTLSIRYIARQAWQCIIKDHIMFNTVLSIAITSSAAVVLAHYNKMLVAHINLSPKMVGYMYSLVHLLPMIVSLIALLLKKGNKPLLGHPLHMASFLSLVIGLTVFISEYYTIGAIVCYLAMQPLIESYCRAELQNNITNESVRSTISSIASFLYSIINAVFFLIVGLVAEYSFSFATALMSLLLVLVTSLLIFSRYKVVSRALRNNPNINNITLET